MEMMTALAVGGGGSLLLFAIVLCGDMECCERGPLGRLLNLLTSFLDFWTSEKFLKIVEKVLGRRCVDRVTAIQDYVCFQRNPILPAMYLVLVAVGFTVFVSFAFPYLPYHAEKDWGISFYHKINAFLIVGGCLVVFWANLSVDPGVITPENVEREKKGKLQQKQEKGAGEQENWAVGETIVSTDVKFAEVRL
ncbi:hypothetical protein GUITHDRAFT_148965 [Guillardia theta CCMP2712]|uniref:Uncharacterized protein n=1 Tax=Guillardia theta (strain CCMP2712) TaxID=905079 RepID=L1I7S0_GUITC|nr:hypothetical protein GUITHDRAFT_148965 [Guillardia theta CCMP2712]EKX31949.1 hypothetical protein GUITHDRAFT_148965 [Guillardia theta CCMP2712]|eukprot:XP_005818929.1 hypothetical protein GUITHDRAFT_148965 [Guillardia theta CCMP2712]